MHPLQIFGIFLFLLGIVTYFVTEGWFYVIIAFIEVCVGTFFFFVA